MAANAMDQLKSDVSAWIADMKAREEKFHVDMAEREAGLQKRIDEAVAKAMADDEIRDTEAVMTMRDDIAKARSEFPPIQPPPQPPPPFEASGNAE